MRLDIIRHALRLRLTDASSPSYSYDGFGEAVLVEGMIFHAAMRDFYNDFFEDFWVD